ncbi:uncharacterized protein TNCT_136751 [Trichonephila clavata]|uniref:Uncharacterized protein n=1 Tax=Trichonephila clavata TaxID=2740835 RepID=A0A8X6EZM0_TRICU|nr:uncharacterized protein TNCT_136751 [Trichonephila clavata]
MSDDYELPHTHTPAEIEKYLKTSNKHLRYSSSFLQKPSSVKCGYYCMKIGIETHPIPLDDGNYTVRDLNNTIRNTLKGEAQFGINFTTSRIVLKLESGCSIDFSQGELHKILGFEQKIYDQPEETARYLANISRGIDDIHIHCDIIHGTLYNVRTSDVLYSFTPSNPPGSLIKIDEINPLFVSVNRSKKYHGSGILTDALKTIGRRLAPQDESRTFIRNKMKEILGSGFKMA